MNMIATASNALKAVVHFYTAGISLVVGELFKRKEGRLMVICTVTTLALYCSHCGKIHTHDVSRFSLKACNRAELQCNCGHVLAKISSYRGSYFLLTLYCELCRKNHILSIDYRQSGSAKLSKLYCGENNLELGFSGNRQLIEQTLERHRSEVNRALPDLTSSDNENSQVLLDILNRVHDIAENGGVVCHCGTSAIRAQVLPACIELRCQNCGACETVLARNEADLSRLESIKMIELASSRHSRQTH